MDDDAVLALAADLEGHPDNVAAAMFGGLTVAYLEGGRFRASSVAVDPRVRVVAFVPPAGVETSVARGPAARRPCHGDAAANAGRAALLVAALGDASPELLLAATEDRLHQDFREPAMPESLSLVRALRADGLPAVVSGAGPTVLVLTTDQPSQQPDAVAALAPRAGPRWRSRSTGTAPGSTFRMWRRRGSWEYRAGWRGSGCWHPRDDLVLGCRCAGDRDVQ